MLKTVAVGRTDARNSLSPFGGLACRFESESIHLKRALAQSTLTLPKCLGPSLDTRLVNSMRLVNGGDEATTGAARTFGCHESHLQERESFNSHLLQKRPVCLFFQIIATYQRFALNQYGASMRSNAISLKSNNRVSSSKP
jgi:hypothetical protein